MITKRNIETNKRRIVLVFFGILISFIKNYKKVEQTGGDKQKKTNTCYKIEPVRFKSERLEGSMKIFSIIKYLWTCQGYLKFLKIEKWKEVLSNLTPTKAVLDFFPSIFYVARFFGILVLSAFLLVFSLFAAIFKMKLSQLDNVKFVDFLLTIWKIFTLSWISNAIMMSLYIYNYRKLVKENKPTNQLNNLLGYGGLDEFMEGGFENTATMIFMIFVYAFYYNIVSLSTVGFGDIYPKGFFPRTILIYYALFLITGMAGSFYNTTHDV